MVLDSNVFHWRPPTPSWRICEPDYRLMNMKYMLDNLAISHTWRGIVGGSGLCVDVPKFSHKQAMQILRLNKIRTEKRRKRRDYWITTSYRYVTGWERQWARQRAKNSARSKTIDTPIHTF